jgi:hypothetical protein
MRGVPCTRLGEVTERDGLLRWGDRTAARVDLAGLYPRWRNSLGLP